MSFTRHQKDLAVIQQSLTLAVKKEFLDFPVMACFCLHSSRLSHSPYRYGLSLFRFQFCNFWLSLFTMTKRDSLLADLPSLRDLRMASEQELHTPMEPVSKSTTVTPAIPMPASDDASTFTAPHLSCNLRAAHTATFKIVEYGNKDPELVVEEVDGTGYLKIKTPETLFNGIAGHVRDVKGNVWIAGPTDSMWPSYHDYDDYRYENTPQTTDP